MRVIVRPGRRIAGATMVPGDKSIAHRLLILAATAEGSSSVRGLPGNLDVMTTARALRAVAPAAAPGLDRWLAEARVKLHPPSAGGVDRGAELKVEGEGRVGLRETSGALDCTNSGTTLRLLAGVLAGSPFRSILDGDETLRRRPMERVARPLRAMGATVSTDQGRPPVRIEGHSLSGVSWATEVPSAQVKGAVLLAGLVADGATRVDESAPTRDHTERLLDALGAPVERDHGGVGVRAFQHGGLDADVPGDVSSAMFLIAAAGVTAGEVRVTGVGLNPTRTAALEVARRMGVTVTTAEQGTSVGEPFGSIDVAASGDLTSARIDAATLPLLVDEVPALAALAVRATGETRFEEAGELRVKESDRLTALGDGIRELGGTARVEGDALVVLGGDMAGGATDARGDHRLAMAFVVAALGARGPSVITGVETAAVSFPGFLSVMSAIGADVEVEP